MLTDYPDLLEKELKALVNGIGTSKDVGIIFECVPLAEQYFRDKNLAFINLGVDDTPYWTKDKCLHYAGNPIGVREIERVRFPLRIIWYSVASSQEALNKSEELRQYYEVYYILLCKN